MGGDLGPKEVVSGIAKCVKLNPDLNFIVHGNYEKLFQLIKNNNIQNKCEIVDAKNVVSMDQKPSYVIRNGQETSMWSAIESVKTGKANACVSGGNTGALMALSVIRLRKSLGVTRPAIACLWPSENKSGFNIVLDVGADIRADRNDLLQYAIMGSRYAKQGFDILRPRIGLLNVGTEEHKGSTELKEAYDLIKKHSKTEKYQFVGFVEGGDIPANSVDIIVTDGFTGNIAIKTAEGTSNLIAGKMRNALSSNIFSKIGSLFIGSSFLKVKREIDPRNVNGGVFLGLNGIVIKSHGSADRQGIASAISLGYRLSTAGFHNSLGVQIEEHE
jgi:glycerol-3-phosphate acyltransferase PlsX